MTTAAKWSTFWKDLDDTQLEVFVSPDGHRFKRATSADAVDLVVPQRHGLPDLRLSNIDHWWSA